VWLSGRHALRWWILGWTILLVWGWLFLAGQLSDGPDCDPSTAYICVSDKELLLVTAPIAAIVWATGLAAIFLAWVLLRDFPRHDGEGTDDPRD
jgi:hypothetical protein